MDNVIIIAVVLVVVGLAAWYVIRAKKKGVKCIGCPSGGCGCDSGCTGGCSGCAGSCADKND